MAQSREFRRRLNRARLLFIYELKTGCLDCPDPPKTGYCEKHRPVGKDLLLTPQKYINLTSTGMEWTDEGKRTLGIRET